MKFEFRKIFITPVGLAVLVITFVMLIRSLLSRNAYEIVLSSAALLLLLLLGVVGWWKAKKLALMEPNWKPPSPMTACAGEQTIISGIETQVPLFFRMHFVVNGNFSPSSSPTVPLCLRVRNFSTNVSISRSESTAKILIDFPMSGIFQGEGLCRLRDIFGFFSFPCGVAQARTLKIRSTPYYGKQLFINAQSGAEDRRNKHSTDEERYYMREYTPGDRFRDINWKSSEKIDMLITRISPDNQDKVSRIEIYFRNFGPTGKVSLEALWLLDRAKAKLSFFLRSLKDEQANYIFDIHAAGAKWEIEDDAALESFLDDLAGLSFAAAENEAAPKGKGDLFVFSTACDKQLSSFLMACNPRPVSLFYVQNLLTQRRRDKKEAHAAFLRSYATIAKNMQRRSEIDKTEILFKRDFIAKGCLLHPHWLVREKIKPMNSICSKIDITYAGTKL